MPAGSIPAPAAKASKQETLVAQHMVEHAGKKAGFARGIANAPGRYSGRGNKSRELLRLSREEGKCLNRQHFSRFSGDRSAPFHGLLFAIR